MRALQELLGHKNIQMTQRYSHLSSKHLQGAVKLLDDIIPPAARLLKEGKPEEFGIILTPNSEFEKIGTANHLKALEMV